MASELLMKKRRWFISSVFFRLPKVVQRPARLWLSDLSVQNVDATRTVEFGPVFTNSRGTCGVKCFTAHLHYLWQPSELELLVVVEHCNSSVYLRR